MKFLSDGADIPDDLIRSVTAGEVVFLCGAGVSKAAGMPLFDELTERVYELLPATRDDEAPEKEAFDRREYDRVLRALEKRTRRSGDQRSRVREVVGKVLAARDDAPLVGHVSLLKLSRDQGGRVRLLTTNFDTLFERAAARYDMPNVPSYAGKSLPKPGGARDYGILHLHGRIGDYPPLDETDLILTSSDFGDAYLRDGWASQYIEDRMRINVLVLVGYAANDTAFRLLLEALDADRERFRDLRKIYAIEKGGEDTAAHWRAKGIEPIEFNDFPSMYTTLSEWANYNDSPIAYRRKRLTEILAKTPDETVNFEYEQLKFMIHASDGLAGIMELNPTVAWMPFFIKLDMIRKGESGLLPWIDRNLTNEEAVRAIIVGIHLLDPGAADYINDSIHRRHAELPPVLAKSWRLMQRLIRSQQVVTIGRQWLAFGPSFRQGEFSSDLLADLARALRPMLVIKPLDDLLYVRTAAATRPGDLMSIDFVVDSMVSVENVLQIWPDETPAKYDSQLLDLLTGELESALYEAVQACVEGEGRDTITNGWGCSDSDVPSISNSPQNDYRSGFNAIARVIGAVWSRLARKDLLAATAKIGRWEASQFRLLRRLALFACADSAVSADLASAILNNLPQGELFLTASTVEVVRLLRARWDCWTDAVRARIEHRLCLGPAPECFRMNADKAIASSIYGILGQLRQEGFALGTEALSKLTDIAGRWPQWRPRPPEQAGFHIWADSVQPFVSDAPSMSGIPVDQLILRARQEDETSSFCDGETWAALCRSDPEHALGGLETASKSKLWPSREWQIFLNSSASFNQPAIKKRISCILADCDSAQFSEIVYSAASWLDYSFADLENGVVWRLWDLILDASVANQSGLHAEKDLLTASMNEPAGRLARIATQRLSVAESEEDSRANSIARLDRLVSAGGVFGTLARVRLAAELPRLHSIEPEWATERLIPLFDWAAAGARDAWLAIAYSKFIGSPALFSSIKAPFLALFRRRDMPTEQRAAFAEWLVVILESNLAGKEEYTLTFPEAHSALRKAGVEALQRVGHRLTTTLKAASLEDRGEQWRNVIQPIFQGLWPLDIDLRSSSLTHTLVNILIETGDSFQAASEAILPFIEAEEQGYRLALFSIAQAEDQLFEFFPETMLNLIAAIVGETAQGSVYQLSGSLERVRTHSPALADTRTFQKLLSMAAII